MSVFTYTATRSLAPGHSAQDLIKLELRTLVRPLTVRAKVKQNTAIGGALESILYREERAYQVRTPALDPFSQVALQVQELFASTFNGETFIFDRHGTIAVPDNPVTCYMESTSLTESEVANKYHRFTWKFREA